MAFLIINPVFVMYAAITSQCLFHPHTVLCNHHRYAVTIPILCHRIVQSNRIDRPAPLRRLCVRIGAPISIFINTVTIIICDCQEIHGIRTDQLLVTILHLNRDTMLLKPRFRISRVFSTQLYIRKEEILHPVFLNRYLYILRITGLCIRQLICQHHTDF